MTTILVTGATSGIGLAAVQRIAAGGRQADSGGRDPAKLTSSITHYGATMDFGNFGYTH
jgi:NAD(P)-dependent dehydrogenase (short-subunit alcohol dehydrogenase family)